MKNFELINGIVESLKISQKYEDFVFTETDKNIAGATAIGAAAVGLLFNSAALASASGGAEIDVECFTCSVNNTLLVGRFHKVEFKEGEKIEFLTQSSSHGAVVYAARNPKERMLWMQPYQMRGHVAQKKNDWKWTAILSLLVSIFFTLVMWLYLPFTGKEPNWIFPVFFLGSGLMVAIVNIWVRSRFTHFALKATEVIRALGYKNPESVDLPALSKIAEKRIQTQTGKLPSVLSPWSFWY